MQTTKTSVHGAINMLGLAKRVRAKILQASTSEVYGDPDVHPQTEDYWGHVNPIGPRSCYDEGKRCAETLFFDYRRQHNLPIKVARIFNTYGPRMHPNDGRVVSNFIVQALLGRDITIYGDGSQTRSFCYVDDLIDGLMRLMATPDSVTGPINIGNPDGVHHPAAGEPGDRADRLAFAASCIGRCRRTIRGSAARTSPRPSDALDWSPRTPLKRWAEAHHRLFRGTAERSVAARPLDDGGGLSGLLEQLAQEHLAVLAIHMQIVGLVVGFVELFGKPDRPLRIDILGQDRRGLGLGRLVDDADVVL